jgi:L,D-transpeptidase YbiS
MGIPSSHGCIKMHNQDVIRLFNTVPVGTRVLIQE